MNEQLSFVAETLEGAEVINNLVRTNLRDGGYLLAEFKNFGGSAGEHAAAKLFVAAPKLLKFLAVMFDSYENGVPCYESPDDASGFVGNAFRLSEKDFHEIGNLLDEFDAPRTAATE